MKKERKNEAIWNIFRESGVLMAVCGDMTSQDENELYDEIASAVEADRARISEYVKNRQGDILVKNPFNDKEMMQCFEKDTVLSIINPSKE